jgi:hypothetical protein
MCEKYEMILNTIFEVWTVFVSLAKYWQKIILFKNSWKNPVILITYIYYSRKISSGFLRTLIFSVKFGSG